MPKKPVGYSSIVGERQPSDGPPRAGQNGTAHAGLLCGIDEAGRGPIAGPVTAGAVILPADFPRHLLDDSKKLEPDVREELAILIRRDAIAWATGWSSAREIDRFNIHRATLLAMLRALRGLAVRPDIVQVDGRFTLPVQQPCTAIVGGDTMVAEIQAASILAKTDRDRFMRRYDRIESAYAFAVHKGYATPSHRFLVKLHGRCAIHRQSFQVR
jgi:ribonuclease HII